VSKKFIVLVSLVLVLGPAGNALGVHIWDDGGSDHLWSTAQNGAPIQSQEATILPRLRMPADTWPDEQLWP